MTFSEPQTLKAIADIIGTQFVGDESFPVLGTNEIHMVRPGDIVFVNHPKYYDKALNSAATIILIDKEVACPEGKALLISDDPFRDFNKINTYFTQIYNFKKDLNDAQIGEGTFIHPSVVLGNQVKIGKNCHIFPNVVIGDRTEIGDNVIIQSNTVLGGDAFYYRKIDGNFDRLISVGNVVIENNVEIGNGCTIDRGVTASTVIGEGSVLDNQIQIGHDTIIGKKCLIASQTGIAGCCVIEDEVTIWGQVGMASGVRVEKGTVLLAKCGVNRDLKKGTYFGAIAEEFRDYLRKEVRLKNLK
ncbi:UDP-3-O-(3-hydroxymyristoyl)glucosamine N-acyltransferase [Riemerella anatipestifer]|uniref:UDP-3-O-(3-hydroxymyristoyl)glucosamine N-acyltransferase n=1 Tax=Riemerella anatipestifer TaxID=34085 RepID=UPI0023637BF5|nr:LpxD N-terminal domain-containing protein [Riemerella anatipestifer]MDD1552839.1 UDP-3-O-(3-hydroxymyristoyl)glucosamine N-acyltransferase [Riemerella anatipestifer]MDD1595460.1 UDP-3-O-(3-hydroxymyristoyl)glucosamine N-acyltransferase [Riemerella anatipestifer]MDY3333436.1 LpxD N-terminal domain-containing protein [Riemerella anatipestifer]MDY3379685.1 LpxD N-terminal domain-containing protein [Riemerella anatipestifer]MDY3383701.1 LpxD N-terminal domain-containing protein [Riemerella anat